jgi:hypothetical protein
LVTIPQLFRKSGTNDRKAHRESHAGEAVQVDASSRIPTGSSVEVSMMDGIS